MIKEIHTAKPRFVLAITGGGTGAISDLLSVPGASATVLEATVPYHQEALSRYLGTTPAAATSAATARSLAMMAWLRARDLAGTSNDIFGLGATSALATRRTRRGDDRCHIVLQSGVETIEVSLVLDGRERKRADEEQVVADLILHCIAKACGVSSLPPELLPGEELVTRRHQASPDWSALLTVAGGSTYRGKHPVAIFPGAFNPIHDGHREILLQAGRILQQKVYLEISILNVDKPPIDFLEMFDRQQNLGDYPLIFSSAPTFQEKSRVFPGCTFVVGADTMIRIADRKYYGGDETRLNAAIDEMLRQEVGFLVFGRVEDGHFLSLADLELPPGLREICQGVDEVAFRQDISSSQIRQDHSNTNP